MDKLVSVTGQPQKLAYSVEEASELTSLSKPFLRSEIKRGKLRIKKFGRRVLIMAQDLKAYLNHQPAAESIVDLGFGD